MEISGKTKIAGIFGYPIEHTLSPLMHNSAFRKMNLDICYVAFRVSPEALSYAVQSIRSLDLLGVNITIPHKEKVMTLLDKVNEEAAFIGAVNTITNDDGTLTGYNTDGKGFMSSLAEEDISVDKKDICIIGAGGASRAISYYLSEKASKITLYDIDKLKAERLATDLNKIRDNVFVFDDIRNMGKPDIIINASPLGLKQDDPLPLDPSYIDSDMIICDLVYKETRLIQEAENKNAKTMNGLGMLLWQGVLASELWTGKKPPVDIMRDVLMSNIK